jgi:transposase
VGLVTDARGTRVAVVTDAADVPETVPGPVALATPPAVATVPAGVPVVADRAYDSDPLRGRLAGDGSRLPAPHRATRTKPPTGDGRRMRRGKRRWVVGRTFAWLHADRRVVARFGREVESFDGFVHLACAFIALDQRS